MLITSSPWSLPLYKLLLLDPPAQIFAENTGQKAPKKTGGWGKGKGRKDAKNSIKGKGGKYSRELVIGWKSTISRENVSLQF